MIGRFLNDPAKPAILAIARPVTKKNLAALVHAYGRSPQLQEAANLVLIAGTRDDFSVLEPEIRGNLTELLALIDRYDLYGRIAYPKDHGAGDIPAIYAYARRRRGVFVNPALSEPFGLTLLEAAASGLPVVATDSGGPNDIIETCGNGLLVDPHSPGAIAEAVLSILRDSEAWGPLCRCGIACGRGIRLGSACRAICRSGGTDHRPARRFGREQADQSRPAAGVRHRRYAAWMQRIGAPVLRLARGAGRHDLRDRDRPQFPTARSRCSASRMRPLPEILITSVGSEIYHRAPGGATYCRDMDWGGDRCDGMGP